MKKPQKIIGISFFSLLALTFFMLFINDIAAIGDVIDYFHYFKEVWGYIISWFLELALSITIIVISVLTLVPFLQNKEVEEKKLWKNNNLLLGTYLAVSVLAGIFVLINVSQIASGNLAKPIVLIVFQALGAIAFFLAIFQWEKMLINKIIAGIGYILLFTSLVISCSNGLSGFAIVFAIFMFLTIIVGAIHIGTYDVDLSKFLKLESVKKEEPDHSVVPEETKAEEEEKSTVDQRLAKLQDLRSQGLISEEEYEEKRKEIINTL